MSSGAKGGRDGRFSATNQPANRGRKPNKPFNPMDDAVRVGTTKVRVLVNGRPKMVTREERRVLSLIQRGLKGSVRAMRELMIMRRDAPMTELRRKLVLYWLEDEVKA